MVESDQDEESILQQRFQLDVFREGQREVIRALLAGRSAAAIFPTGGGKSLCYQLPALMLAGTTVVVSPLMALMKDQVDSLRRKGIHAVRLDSSQSAEESNDAVQHLRSGIAKILYVAPERFFNERFRQILSGIRISLFAIDEAHCISQWGHNFRPDYLKLSILASQLRVERILALTATATPSVILDIRREFAIAEEDVIQTPFYRANLELRFQLTTESKRREILRTRLRDRPSGPTLVYVTLQKTAEEVAEYLVHEGFEAKAYHAGMDDDQRREVQEWFMKTSKGIVAATIAFGMGVDKSDIRYVYHYNASKSLESYAQEIGRAGRDGEGAICETYLVPEDRVVLENFVHGEIPSLQSVRTLLELVKHQAEQFHLSFYSLSYQCDMRELVVRTMLTYLELDGFLEAIGPRYDDYKFKPKISTLDILKNFDGERKQFASSVLAMAVKKKVWQEIDVTRAVQRLGCERERILRMLEYFSERGWIELQASGLVHGYRKRKEIESWEKMADDYYSRLMERERSEIARIDQLYRLACLRDCQASSLANYFGDSMERRCGICSACRGERIEGFPTVPSGTLGDSVRTNLKRLICLHPEALSDARQQARFLVGITSPMLIRKRLTKDPFFGTCSEIPFESVFTSLREA